MKIRENNKTHLLDNVAVNKQHFVFLWKQNGTKKSAALSVYQ